MRRGLPIRQPIFAREEMLRMRYAVDKTGRRIAPAKEKLGLCPICGESLLVKIGSAKESYWVHRPTSTCTGSHIGNVMRVIQESGWVIKIGNRSVIIRASTILGVLCGMCLYSLLALFI
jgi:hypothetical protein